MQALKAFIQKGALASGYLLLFAGMLFVFVLGTAIGVPMHAPGLVLLGVGTFLVLVPALSMDRRTLKFASLPFTELGLIAAFGYLVARCWVSPVIYLAELDLFLLVAGLAVFLVCRFTPNLDGFVRGLMVFFACFALVQLPIFHHQAFTDRMYTPWGFLGLQRPTGAGESGVGFFFHQNPAGAFNALLAAFLAGWVVLARQPLLLRIFTLSGWAAAVANTLMSFSRGAFLSLLVGHAVLVGLALLFVLNLKGSLWKRAFVGFGGIVMVLVSGAMAKKWAFALTEKRFGDDATLEKLGGLNGRQGAWDVATTMFMDSPVVGHGSRMFEVREYLYWPSDLWKGAADAVYAHNEYLQVLADYGFLGGVAVVLTLLLSFFMVIRVAVSLLLSARSAPGTNLPRALVVSCAAVLAASAVDVIFSFSWHFLPIVLLVAVAVGILVRLSTSAAPGQDSSSGTAPGSKLSVGLGLVWLALGALSISYATLVGSRYAHAYWKLRALGLGVEQGTVQGTRILEEYRTILHTLPRFPYYLQGGVVAREQALQISGNERQAMELMNESLSYLREAVKSVPESCIARRELATTCLNLGLFDEAVENMEVAIETGVMRESFFRSHTDLAEIHLTRAIVEGSRGDNPGASRSLQLAEESLNNEKKVWGGKEPKFPKFRELREMVDREIAFYKKTGEWRPEDGK